MRYLDIRVGYCEFDNKHGCHCVTEFILGCNKQVHSIHCIDSLQFRVILEKHIVTQDRLYAVIVRPSIRSTLTVLKYSVISI